MVCGAALSLGMAKRGRKSVISVVNGGSSSIKGKQLTILSSPSEALCVSHSLPGRVAGKSDRSGYVFLTQGLDGTSCVLVRGLENQYALRLLPL